jgi:hypothetical protein
MSVVATVVNTVTVITITTTTVTIMTVTTTNVVRMTAFKSGPVVAAVRPWHRQQRHDRRRRRVVGRSR